MRLDRQASKAGHLPQTRAVAGNREANFFRADAAARGFQGADLAFVSSHSGDLAVLDDIHAKTVGCARVAPGDRVVPRVAGTLLHRRTDNRETRVVVIQVRYFRFQGSEVPQFAIGTGEPHAVIAARGGVTRGRAVQ